VSAAELTGQPTRRKARPRGEGTAIDGLEADLEALGHRVTLKDSAARDSIRGQTPADDQSLSDQESPSETE
jgi:hypothetical protein